MMRMKYTATTKVEINKHPPGTTVLAEDIVYPTTVQLPDGMLSWAFENELENVQCLFSLNTPTSGA